MSVCWYQQFWTINGRCAESPSERCSSAFPVIRASAGITRARFNREARTVRPVFLATVPDSGGIRASGRTSVRDTMALLLAPAPWLERSEQWSLFEPAAIVTRITLTCDWCTTGKTATRAESAGDCEWLRPYAGKFSDEVIPRPRGFVYLYRDPEQVEALP
jgi:hypothetical protein